MVVFISRCSDNKRQCPLRCSVVSFVLGLPQVSSVASKTSGILHTGRAALFGLSLTNAVCLSILSWWCALKTLTGLKPQRIAGCALKALRLGSAPATLDLREGEE